MMGVVAERLSKECEKAAGVGDEMAWHTNQICPVPGRAACAWPVSGCLWPVSGLSLRGGVWEPTGTGERAIFLRER